MGRKITQKEIDSLKEWNKTRGLKPNHYVSVEAYQDMLDWIGEPSEEMIALTQEDIKYESDLLQ